MSIPYLKKEHDMTRLYVKDKPFYARSGEIHNSSSSSLEYMEERVWPALRQLHVNCVVAPIYWECVEPEEGVFDFTLKGADAFGAAVVWTLEKQCLYVCAGLGKA